MARAMLVVNEMRARLHSKLIAALLAPALLVSASAQALQLVRCGSEVRLSCCCPKQSPAPATKAAPGLLTCCDQISVPSAPPQDLSRATPPTSAPVLVAALGPPSASLRPVTAYLPRAPSRSPPPRQSPVLANCALLI